MDIAAYLLDCKGICLSAQQRAAVEAPVGTLRYQIVNVQKA